jgi:hypothetical protein
MNTTYFLNLASTTMFKTPSLYLGMSTTTPTISGTNVTEPSGATGYARILIPSASLSTPTAGVITNTALVSYPRMTSDGGTATYWVIYDALTGGNLIAYGAFTNSRALQINSQVILEAGKLTFSMS